jgi:hypothetical protein
MAAPANDDRASAQLVPVGSYWGVVSGGSTVDATEDAGGPVDGYGAKDVFYYWDDLPAGAVYIFIKPHADSDPAYSFESATFSGAPGDWDSADTWLGGSSGDVGFTCRFQTHHTGGPLSLVVFTYDGDPEISFDFGWAHELDAEPSHWSDEQEDPWDFKDNSDSFDLIGISAIATRRGIKQTWYDLIAGSTPPPDASGHALCAFENARDGVFDIPAATVHTCSYIGPGLGTGDDFLGDDVATQMVGSYYVGTTYGTIFPTVTTGRGDRVGVEESVGVWNIDTDKFVGAIVKADHYPADFTAYQTANDGPDDALVWGWQFVNDDWETQNLNLGDITVSNAFGGSADATDTCTVSARLVDPSMIYSDFATVFDAPNRVWLSPSGNSTVFSYILPADAGATEVVNLGSSGTTNLSYADRTSVDSMLVTAPGDTSAHKRLVVAFLAEEALADTPPTFGDPSTSSSPTNDWITIGNRAVGVSGTLGWEARLPTWRAFIGFELVPLGGWHVGRVGSGSTFW